MDRYIQDRQEVFDSHFPSGTSFRNFIHFAQSVGKENVRKFNHGKKGNLKIYGSEEPPIYNFSNIKVPAYEFIGTEDWLSTIEDSESKANEMQAAEIHFLKGFDHLEFIRGKRAKTELHPKILHILTYSVFH